MPKDPIEPRNEAGANVEACAPRWIDEYVGRRIRERRCELGWTQERLASNLGISYQQVQKYEVGSNRISAGRLYQMAIRLEVDVGYFYERATSSRPGAAREHGGKNRLPIDLVRNFANISNDPVRAAVCGLIRTLAEPGATLRRGG